jgi:DUF1680 family protein
LLAQLPGYFYNTTDAGVWVNLYAQSTAELRLASGLAVKISQQTRYPWDGEIILEVQGAGAFDLNLRIPAWCESGAILEVNGQRSDVALSPGTFAKIHRHWRFGDRVRLSLPMPVRKLEAHPYVAENVDRLAMTRGPIVYCIEAADHPGIDVRNVKIGRDAQWTVGPADGPGGGVNLCTSGFVQEPEQEWERKLYRTLRPKSPAISKRDIPVTAIPYCMWANRSAGPMRVWI